MDYYNEIKERLVNNEVHEKVKNYSIESYRVITYFEIGKLLYQAGNKYGESIIQQYSKKLTDEVGNKYNKSTLFKMRKFYLVFSDEKVAPLVPQLSWSHCLLLLSMKDVNKINYYIGQVVKRNLSKRQLKDAIKNQEYERLPIEFENEIVNKKQGNVSLFIKNPILIKNRNDYEIITEKILQKLILEDIESFMNELGNNFSFIGSEYKIKIGNSFNYLDLLLFNIEFNCYVVVELKVTRLKKEHIGQILIYMNYIDENIKSIYQKNTIGIIICKEDNEYIIKYCSDERIISRRYKFI